MMYIHVLACVAQVTLVVLRHSLEFSCFEKGQSIAPRRKVMMGGKVDEEGVNGNMDHSKKVLI